MKNKWIFLSGAWFCAMIYALLLHSSSGNTPSPPFPHFDKLVHTLLFFIQFWLIVRAFIHAKKALPYWQLLLLSLILAIGTEWAQAALTTTRQADVWDGVADLLGASVALLLGRHALKIWTRQSA